MFVLSGLCVNGSYQCPICLAQVTLTAESFGGCLALRCLAAAPELFERAVLVNPATCFAKSYGGLLNIAAGTHLLSVFPEQLYQVAFLLADI